MAAIPKHIIPKASKKKQTIKTIAKSYPASGDTLFPEKLARANELLSKARLLPR